MDAQLINETEKKFSAAVDHFRTELNKIRTGRANVAMLDGIMVQAYGSPTPLIQVGGIAVVDSQLLQITPFDPANLAAISTAIRENQALGLNPSDDGRVVRIPIPPLTTERRQTIVKQLHAKKEDSLVSLRNVRHDAMKELDLAKKDSSISQDEHKRLSDKVDSRLSDSRSKIELLAQEKEKEIMTV